MKKLKYLIPAFALVCLIGIGTTVLAKGVFVSGKKSAIATTTLSYMTSGTATTTLTYDTYVDGLTVTDEMTLLVRLTASSTSTHLLINQEYSPDSTLGCVDWYQASQPTFIQNATTTVNDVDISTVPQYSWFFASTTPGLALVSGNSNSDTRAIPIKSPTRCTRFIFSLPAGSTNGAIWAQVIPVKQNP